MSADLEGRRQVILALELLTLFFDWKILNGNDIKSNPNSVMSHVAMDAFTGARSEISQ